MRVTGHISTAYSDERLATLPKVKVGESFSCEKCNGTHKLSGDDTDYDGVTLMFYKCRGQDYLGAVNGRLIVTAYL